MHQEQDRISWRTMVCPPIGKAISCSIFQQKEFSIKEFTDRLNKVEDYQHKIELASDLSRYADMLLECLEYNANSLDCKNCRIISNIRKKTADIIIKAKGLV